MLPIPAIDIQKGKCVRLKMGDLTSAKIYYQNPLEAAEFWIKKGTKRLHLVDLDGALQGTSANISSILEIRNAFPDLQIQVGGGIRSFEAIENYFNNNIDFLILGSVAIKNKDFFIEACRNYPNKIILGLDAKRGFVSAEAWTEMSNIKALDLVKDYSSLPINSIIYTDISKDGMMGGPNIEETLELANFSSIPIIASGGVRNLEDLKLLSETKKVYGAICGKSLYEGTLDLGKALDFFKKK
jgi:phosphoribosylformimino-5-aminoimidazole carboxamide ribotide isomerase